jgi:hypothetical protein
MEGGRTPCLSLGKLPWRGTVSWGINNLRRTSTLFSSDQHSFNQPALSHNLELSILYDQPTVIKTWPLVSRRSESYPTLTTRNPDPNHTSGFCRSTDFNLPRRDPTSSGRRSTSKADMEFTRSTVAGPTCRWFLRRRPLLAPLEKSPQKMYRTTPSIFAP